MHHIKQFLDSRKIASQADVSPRHMRVAQMLASLGVVYNDANTTLFTAAQLDIVEAAFLAVRRKLAEAPAILPLISLDSGAATYSWQVYDASNAADQIADGVALTASDLTGTPASQTLVQYRDSFTLADQEVRQAALAGRPIETFGAQSVAANLLDRMDQMHMIGDGTRLGLLNASGTTTYTIPADGTGSSALWSAKTPELKLRDMINTVDRVKVVNEGRHVADTLVMPAGYLDAISAEKRTTAGGTDQTVLQAFAQARPGVRVVGTYFTADSPVSVTTTAGKLSHRLVAFDSAPDVLGRIVALAPSILTTDVLDLVTRFQAKMRCGSVAIRRPAAVCIAKPASGGI